MAIKISWPRILAVAILYAIASEIVMTLGAFMDMSYYYDPSYFGVWSKLMMPAAGPPPAEFYYFGMAFQLVTGFLFALVYRVIKGAVPGKGWKNKGLMYGFLIFLVTGIPTTMMLYLLINLPVGLLLSWMLQSLVVYLIMGLVAAKLLK
jgi:hypothetical protein